MRFVVGSIMEPHPPRDSPEYIDWLLEHKRKNLREDMGAAYVWDFVFRTKDVAGMRVLVRALQRLRYVTTYQEVVEETTRTARGKWHTVQGPPTVSALWKGKPNATMLKKRLAALLRVAKRCGGRYEFLESMDLASFETLHGPPRAMTLADAVWRLRHYTDGGLKEGGAIEYVFCVDAKDTRKCSATLRRAGVGKVERAPKHADWAISVRVPGVNEEQRLRKAMSAMRKVVKSAGGTLSGVFL